MKKQGSLLLLILCHGTTLSSSHTFDIFKSSSSSTSFIHWIPTIRGGSDDSYHPQDDENDSTISFDSLSTTSTSNTTNNFSLDSLYMYRNVTHMAWRKQNETCIRCQEMKEQIISSLSNLNHDIMILSIRTTMLPSDLLPRGIVELYHHMKMLQIDATLLLSRLNEFHTLVMDAQVLLQSLLETMEQVRIEWTSSLPKHSMMTTKSSSFIGRTNNWYQQICHYLTGIRNPTIHHSANTNHRMNLDTQINILHQTIQMTFQKVDELQQRAHTHIWKDLQSIGTRVQEQVTCMDQLVKEMRDKSSFSNSLSEDTTVQVEIQMSTYYWH